MRVMFDLDGTLCSRTFGKYEKAEPFKDMVELVNDLYNDDHYIIIRTARGMGKFSGDASKAYNEWFALTQKQLQAWGICYHELQLGKPEADLYVDDRAFRVRADGTSTEELRQFMQGMV